MIWISKETESVGLVYLKMDKAQLPPAAEQVWEEL